MYSVVARIRDIKQPRGGYINKNDFDVIVLDDGKELNEEENIHASLIGLAVDYMTRYIMGTQIDDAFIISIEGAKRAEVLTKGKCVDELNGYLSHINGLDDDSLFYACKAVAFDVWFRNPFSAMASKQPFEIEPDKNTIDNVRTLIERSIEFWKKYGPITVDGFTFEPYGYTKTVSSGDGDFLTEDTLWDFKVLKREPSSENTLQIVMYYIMGKHSGNQIFDNIKKVGFYNPRLNKVYILDMNKVSEEIIKTIEKEIICYE